MHENVLPRRSLDLLDRLEAIRSPALEGWILAGGTGLAFRLDHRESEDLDFFRTDDPDVFALIDPLSRLGDCEILQQEEHTLTILLDGTKLSFFSVGDPFLFAAEGHRFFGVADERDIALMKLAAISGRGSRKDFIDLFMILRQPPALTDYFQWLPRKYRTRRFSVYHILKSLTWFEDAEAEPMPRMRLPFNWSACKTFFIREARSIVLPTP